MLKFIYSEKATEFCEIFIVDLSYLLPIKSMVEISQNFVAFSEYMNFIYTYLVTAKLGHTPHSNRIDQEPIKLHTSWLGKHTHLFYEFWSFWWQLAREFSLATFSKPGNVH